MLDASGPSDAEAWRSARVAAILEDVIRRRTAGERLIPEAVVAAHPDLQQDLAAKLRILERVDAAERSARKFDSGLSEELGRIDGIELPSFIPAYVFAELLHRGGQGVVYRARHERTGRDVAVKVLRDGPLSGPDTLARFDREVRVLARFDHPNIVAIHDSGVAAGFRYFVMDYVEGEPLDEFVAGGMQTLDEKLRLFVKICDAVHAAHLHGIIHRDLKPSNIRVDRRGEPHILDFGLAKVGADDIHRWGADPGVTVTGQFVGSLPWASPEQADGSPDRVDLRTDVYSLGVILFQALTDRFPYPVVGNIRDVLTHIVETEPIRPRYLCLDLDEDLETIVLRCLSKKAEDRYQSVLTLGEDIGRYLNREPILARAPSSIYQLKKLVARHKLPAALLVALFVTGIGFAIAMSILYGRATTLLGRAQGAEALADERRVKAEDEASKAETLNRFMGRILQFQSPWKRKSAPPGGVKTAGRDVKLSELLDEAATWIESDFADQPELAATVHLNLGQSFATIGRDAESLAHLRKALEIRQELFGDEDPRTVECLLAMAQPDPARPDEWERVTRKNWEMCIRLFGDRHPLTFWAAKDLIHAWTVTPQEAAEFEQLARRTIALQKQEFDSLYDPAVQTYLANFFVYGYRLDEAESLARETMEMALRQGGPDDYWAGFNNMVLARVARYRGDFADAEQRYRYTIELRKRAQGGDNELTAIPILGLGRLLYGVGRFEEAQPVLREALDMNLRAKGTAGDFTPRCLHELCRVLSLTGKLEEAKALHRQWLSDCQRDLGPNHSETFNAMTKLAEFLRNDGRYAEAESFARTAVEGLRGNEKEKKDYPAHAAKTLACVLCDVGRYEEAEPYFAEALAGFRNQILIDRMIIPGLQLQYGQCLTSLGRYVDAEPLLLASQSTFESLPDETDNLAEDALKSLIELYEAWGQEDKVTEWRAELEDR